MAARLSGAPIYHTNADPHALPPSGRIMPEAGEPAWTIEFLPGDVYGGEDNPYRYNAPGIIRELAYWAAALGRPYVRVIEVK